MRNLRKLIHRDKADNEVDLHFHSYYSDGELSPADLVIRMASEGKKYFH